MISGTSRGLGPRRRAPLPWRTFSLPNQPSSQRTSSKSSMRISLTRRPTPASSRRGRVVPRGRTNMRRVASSSRHPANSRSISAPPGGTRSSGTVIFAMRARHSARRPHRTGASARRTRAVTLLRQPDIVGDMRVYQCVSRHTAALASCRREAGLPSRPASAELSALAARAAPEAVHHLAKRAS